ncbi:MAG: hypothetical protein ACRC6E_11130, partial [Fusobacteriaceae bacterium]
SADLSKLAAEDYNETLQILSEMQAAGVMSFDTMRKMFTGRNVTQIAGVLAQIDGDLAGYNRRMTESSDIVRVTEQASKTWVHELTTLKQALGDASTGLGTFMDSFAPFLSVVNNGIQSVAGNVSVMKTLTAVMSAMTTGAFVLVTALMIANKAFRETASAAAWNGVKSVDKLALGFGGGVFKILKEVKSILGPTGMIITGIATAAIGAVVAVRAYAKAERQRMEALKKEVLAEKQRLSITIAYGKTLDIFRTSALQALTPAAALEKGISNLSESFSYAIGGSKDAADAIIDFIDAVAKKAADLKQIEEETPKNAKEFVRKSNSTSTNAKEMGQRVGSGVLASMDADKRAKVAALLQDQSNMIAVNTLRQKDPNAKSQPVMVASGGPTGRVLTKEETGMLMEFSDAMKKESANILSDLAKSGKVIPEQFKKELQEGMNYRYTNEQERIYNADIIETQFQDSQVTSANAKEQNNIEKLNLYTKFGQTNDARVEKYKERSMKNGVSKAEDLEKRLNNPKFESFLTPDLKNMRKFLKELRKIDSKTFKELSIEEATQIYSDWSELLAANISDTARNLLILSQTAIPGSTTQDILNNMTADEGFEEAVGTETANQLTALRDSKLTEAEKHDALIKIMKDNMNEAAQLYMIGVVNHYSEAFTASGREEYIKSQVQKKIEERQKEIARAEAKKMKVAIPGNLMGKTESLTNKQVEGHVAATYKDVPISMREIESIQQGLQKATPNMSIMTPVKKGDVVGNAFGLRDQGNKTSESVDKYFNKIHAELVAATESFEKFAIKGKFSDRIKLLQNKLKVSASTLNDQIINLYESNIESVNGGMFKKADASTKENAVNNFANKMANVTTANGRTEAIKSMGLGPHAEQKAITDMRTEQGKVVDDSHVELIEREKEMLKFLTGLELPSDIKTKVYANMAESFTKETDLLIANAEKDGMDDQQIAKLKQSRAKLSKGYMLDPDSIEALTKNFEDLKVGEFDLSALQARVTELLMSASKEDHEKAKEYADFLAKITDENKNRAKSMQDKLMQSFEDMFDMFSDGNFRVKATMENAM